MQKAYSDLIGRGIPYENEVSVRGRKCRRGNYNESLILFLKDLELILMKIETGRFDVFAQPPVKMSDISLKRLVKQWYRLHAPRKERNWVIYFVDISSAIQKVQSFEMTM